MKVATTVAALGVAGLAYIKFKEGELNIPTGAGSRSLPEVSSKGYSRSLDDLNPSFVSKAKAWKRAVEARGIKVTVVQTYRSEKLQRQYVEQGKSKVTFGFHNAGLALDFIVGVRGYQPIINGKTYSAGTPFYASERNGTPADVRDEWARNMITAGEIAEDMGMTWGGRWDDDPSDPSAYESLGWDPYHLQALPNSQLASVKTKLRRDGYNFTV